jgi:radical SAM protein with 4Fe4S-binding SPASM domain
MVNTEAGGAPESRPEGARDAVLDWDEFRRTGCNPLPPTALQIETSSICNFRCASCPLAMPEYDRPEKHLSVEEVRRVLDAFPTVKKIELQGIGEVFLNPCILDIVRTAVERDIQVHTFSNASKVDRETAYATVRSGLALVNFSMDGSDEPTFRKLRKGGTLKRYKRCVTNLVEARSALGSKTPVIGVMTVLSKRNVRQIPRMLAIAEELGVDTIVFTKINAAANPEIEEILLGDEERDWIRSLPPYHGKVEVVWAYDEWTTQQRMDCYWPRHMSYVTAEGDVTPCCNFYDARELSFGNVFREDGESIWNGERYREFRRRLMAGDLHDRCKKC